MIGSNHYWIISFSKMNMNEYATGVYVHNAGYIMCHDIFSIYDIRGMFICSDGTLELYVKIRFLVEHFP